MRIRSARRRVVAVVLSLLACGGLTTSLAAGSGSGSGGGGSSSGSPTEVPGEILVKLKTSDALAPLLARYPLVLVDRIGSRPIFRLRAVGGARVKDVLPALSLEAGVMIAEPNGVHGNPEARRNVPWVVGTASAYASQWAPTAMRLADAQALSTGGGVTVAVLDTGVDRTHPLLAGRLLPGFDFVDFDSDPSEAGTTANSAYGHGTHVAGIVALTAPGAAILPLRVLDADGNGNAWVLGEALLHAVDPDGNAATDDGARVINLSLGSLSRTRLIGAIARLASCELEVPDDPVSDRSDPGYADDNARCAAGHGVVVVAAAGNDASDSVKEYPAAEGEHGLLAVAASSSSATLASFSNFGTWIDLAAPGDGITSAVPGGWGTWSGTSMASPFAAGTAALLRAREPALSPVDVTRRMTRAAGTLCGTQLPRLDALAVLTDTVPAATACR